MTIRILQGDVRQVLATLPADSFDCCVTSPPYWGLRDYGVDGQIGLEPTLNGYLETMVEVCRGVRRVLKPEGTFWLNIGDSYAATTKGSGGTGKSGLMNDGRDEDRRIITGDRSNAAAKFNAPRRMELGSLKPKDLCMVPNRLAILLQEDGWYVRSEIIWHKLNPMPESVTDRPTSAHEKVWLLTRCDRYFYDAEEISEKAAFGAKKFNGVHNVGSDRQDNKRNDRGAIEIRNARNVWSITSQPFPGSHFATMPRDLAERCIKAGCPAGGHVLDPFGGAGTTGLVADRLGRHATLIELNPAYIAIASDRLRDDAPLFTNVETCEAAE